MKKTSKEWNELLCKPAGLVIYDPDGWDRQNYEFSFNEELIDGDEFISRVGRSTVMGSIYAFNTMREILKVINEQETIS